MNRKEKKWDLIAIVILLLYPLRHMNLGIDLMDAGYSLGNYQYMATMNETWKLATYLSNALGALLMKLPFGNFWIGMNTYTGLLIGVVSAASYLYCSRQFLNRKLLLFISELVALSLCWAPSTILYQYVGYFFMTISAMLLFQGIQTEKKRYDIIAGVILGFSVIARMPNITYMALIVPVWYAFYLKKEGTLVQLFQKTLWCIAGYLLGLLPGLCLICIHYGIDAYPRMITSLFAMTDQAQDYKPTSMITAMFDDYFAYSIWLILFFFYLAVGIVFFKMAEKHLRKGLQTAGKILYVLGLLVVLRFCYGRGMFGFDYQEAFSYYKWITVYLLVTVLLCIYLLFNKRERIEKRIWACFLLVMIFVTPLGSNNGLYPIINNLFLVGPVSVWLLFDTIEPLKDSFPVKTVTYFLCICVTIQSLLFGVCACFHDAADEKRVQVEIPGSVSTTGMKTTVEKAQNLQELGGYLQENNLLESQVILIGNIPAISYIFDLQPAVFTTWIDLDSNSKVQFEQELQALSPENVIVITSTVIEKEEKHALLKDWMDAYHYESTFQNEAFCVYEQK